MDDDLAQDENIIIEYNNDLMGVDGLPLFYGSGRGYPRGVDGSRMTPLKHSDVAFKMKRLIIQGRCSLSDNCMICLDNMSKSKCIYLPCKHAFHYKCLYQLVERRIYTCPLCRGDFKKYLTIFGLTNADVNNDDDEQIEMTFLIENEFVDIILDWLRQSYEVNVDIMD